MTRHCGSFSGLSVHIDTTITTFAQDWAPCFSRWWIGSIRFMKFAQRALGSQACRASLPQRVCGSLPKPAGLLHEDWIAPPQGLRPGYWLQTIPQRTRYNPQEPVEILPLVALSSSTSARDLDHYNQIARLGIIPGLTVEQLPDQTGEIVDGWSLIRVDHDTRSLFRVRRCEWPERIRS